MSKRVLVTGTSVRHDLLQPIVDAGYTVDNPTHLLSETELKDALTSASAYLLGGDEYASRTALSSARDLKVIAFLGMGFEAFVDSSAAKDLGIPITNTPGTLSNAVAELTTGLILTSTRRLFAYASSYRTGAPEQPQKQHDLSAMHVGIVGLGGVGTRIAEILRKGFGSRVSYYSRTRKPEEENRLGLSFTGLSELVRAVDILVVMTPGNDQTKGLIGKDEVSSFRPGLLLINSARPEIVDPDALLAGLETSQIGYAAFDAFYEQNPGLVERLSAMIPSRLMVTPHLGSLTHEARDGMARKATQSILNILKTGTDPCIVNKM